MRPAAGVRRSPGSARRRRCASGRGPCEGMRRGAPRPAAAGPPDLAPERKGGGEVAFREGDQRPDDEGVGRTMERAGPLRADAGLRPTTTLERRERSPPVALRGLLDGQHPTEIGPAAVADGRGPPAPRPARRATSYIGRPARLAPWAGLPEGLRSRPSIQADRRRFGAGGAPVLGGGARPRDSRRGRQTRPPGRPARSLVSTHARRREASPRYSR